MSNILDRFKTSSIGSQGRIVDYLPKINHAGDFTKIYDIDAILSSWNNILMTPRGSMDHDPNFGSNLYKFIFEPADNSTQDAIKIEIYDSLGVYDSRASISQIDVNFYSNKKGFVVIIQVEYFGYKSNLTLNIDEAAISAFS
jgi:phage baseplate assembly protein W